MCAYHAATLTEFWQQHSDWSQATFGSDAQRGPKGPLKHLLKEVSEVLAKPDDLEEYADCVFLIFDAARRAGFTLEQLVNAMWIKLAVNKTRQWPTLSTANSDEALEHVR